MSEKTKQESKKISIIRAIGIFFLPPFFCWEVTKKKGYSNLAVFITWSYSVTVVAMILMQRQMKKEDEFVVKNPKVEEYRSFLKETAKGLEFLNKQSQVVVMNDSFSNSKALGQKIAQGCHVFNKDTKFKFAESLYLNSLKWCNTMGMYMLQYEKLPKSKRVVFMNNIVELEKRVQKNMNEIPTIKEFEKKKLWKRI